MNTFHDEVMRRAWNRNHYLPVSEWDHIWEFLGKIRNTGFEIGTLEPDQDIQLLSGRIGRFTGMENGLAVVMLQEDPDTVHRLHPSVLVWAPRSWYFPESQRAEKKSSCQVIRFGRSLRGAR